MPLGVTVLLGLMATPSIAAEAPEIDADLQATLIKLDAAYEEFKNGRPAASKALWSHADDVTLSGGAGGAIERGWKNVAPPARLGQCAVLEGFANK